MVIDKLLALYKSFNTNQFNMEHFENIASHINAIFTKIDLESEPGVTKSEETQLFLQSRGHKIDTILSVINVGLRNPLPKNHVFYGIFNIILNYKKIDKQFLFTDKFVDTLYTFLNGLLKHVCLSITNIGDFIYDIITLLNNFTTDKYFTYDFAGFPSNSRNFKYYAGRAFVKMDIYPSKFIFFYTDIDGYIHEDTQLLYLSYIDYLKNSLTNENKNIQPFIYKKEFEILTFNLEIIETFQPNMKDMYKELKTLILLLDNIPTKKSICYNFEITKDFYSSKKLASILLDCDDIKYEISFIPTEFFNDQPYKYKHVIIYYNKRFAYKEFRFKYSTVGDNMEEYINNFFNGSINKTLVNNSLQLNMPIINEDNFNSMCIWYGISLPTNYLKKYLKYKNKYLTIRKAVIKRKQLTILNGSPLPVKKG